jgi:hypothetical protein
MTQQLQLPGFFDVGLTVGNNGCCNIPGYPNLDSLPVINKDLATTLAQFILTHYAPETAQQPKLIQQFKQDCIDELIKTGGTIPHETATDWLYFNGITNKIITEMFSPAPLQHFLPKAS